MITLFRPDTKCALDQVKKVMAEYIRQLPGHIAPVGTALGIIRYELPIDPINILYWLHNQKANTKIYWSGRDEEFELGGVGVADHIKGDGPIDHQHIFGQMRGRLSEDNPNLRYYGGMSFDSSNQSKEWEEFASYQFTVPQFEIVRTKDETVFAFNIMVDNISAENIENILHELEKLDFSSETTYRTPPKVLSRTDLPNRKEWEDVFSNIEDRLKDGAYAKVVLARKSSFDFDVAIRPNALMKHLKDRTPNSFHFCFQPCADTAFLGATPERLYKREGRKVKSEAIAGTRPRGKNQDEDLGLENQLLKSDKDAREHGYVVNTIHATLSNFCEVLKSDKTFCLRKLRGTQHLTTSFEGVLNSDIEDDRILRLLHPTPAVGGYPTRVAIDQIKESEPFNRGWYAGPVGCVGYDSAEFAVAIRSGLIKGNHLSLYAGAGIVAGSTCESEWNEIENKISNFISVFNK